MLTLDKITKTFDIGMEPVHALRGISLEIRSGEFIAIMGSSGSGKSTLMTILGCLDRPSTGRYLLEGEEVQNLSDDQLAHLRNKRIGFVFQQFNLMPRLNALDNVAMPLIYAGVNAHERQLRAKKALESVGLGDRIWHRPNQLSGGQQQRVSIARALVNEPSILLADEPTGALDSQTSQEIMQLVSNLHQSGVTVILVTHESEIASYAKRVVKVKDGLIVSDLTTGTN